MIDLTSQPWPWYVTGPLIGLVIPTLLLVGGKMFGVSENLRHICAVVMPRADFFRYDWRREGGWNLTLAAGAMIGGLIAATFLNSADLAPASIFSWSQLLTLRGFTLIVIGGFLVGFGSKYAGGCTSGHALMGLADFQLPSLIAVLAFFAGGLIVTHFVLPLII